MGKLRILSGRDLGILEQHGFQIVRQRGSHIVMQRWTDGGTATVPVPDHAEIRIGTLQSIIHPTERHPSQRLRVLTRTTAHQINL